MTKEEVELSVYCVHAWESFGMDPVNKKPIAMRCLRCRTIWKKLENPQEPKTIIGYSIPPSQHPKK